MFGRDGADIITDTTEYSPPIGFRWYGMKVIASAVINTHRTVNYTLNGAAATNALAGLTLAAESTHLGEWGSIKLTSGSVAMLKERIT